MAFNLNYLFQLLTNLFNFYVFIFSNHKLLQHIHVLPFFLFFDEEILDGLAIASNDPLFFAAKSNAASALVNGFNFDISIYIKYL